MTPSRSLVPRYIDIDGIKTRYYEAGSGPPLVFVHGAHFGRPSCADDWEHNLEPLSSRFRVYALDKIGQGFTDNPALDEDYTMRTVVSHLRRFIEVLGIEGANLIGHSRGGYAVLRLSLESPEIVRSVIPVSPGTLVSRPNPIYDKWNREASEILDPRERIRYLIRANSYAGDHITSHYLDVVEEFMSLPKTEVANNKFNDGLYSVFKSALVAEQAETHEWIRQGMLTMPVLVVWGFNDPSATLQDAGYAALDLLFRSTPDCEMHILNRSGHYCYREQPDAFNDVIISFIHRQAY